jgi:formylglycine-generating enzyme
VNGYVVFVTWYNTIRFANWLTNGQDGSDTESGSYAISGSGPNWTVSVPSAAQRAAWAAGGSGTRWLLPSEDEWCKAAYYKGGGTNSGYWAYPTRSNTAPAWELSSATGPNPGSNSGNFYDNYYGYSRTGSVSWTASQNYLTDVGAYPNSLSAYGTLDQGGNVYQWNEALFYGSLRGMRGGSWDRSSSYMGTWDRNYDSPEDKHGHIGFRVSMVPEPSTLALLGMGVIGVLGYGWRRRQSPHLGG